MTMSDDAWGDITAPHYTGAHSVTLSSLSPAHVTQTQDT